MRVCGINTGQAEGMREMTQTVFLNYLAQNTIPAAVLAQVKREARARIIERLQAGRADSILTFDDLVLRCEEAIVPR